MAKSSDEAPPKQLGDPSEAVACPKCGNRDLSTMADLQDLVSKPSSQFSSDMAEWLAPPKRPKRPLSKRHRTGFRNSVAFGLFWIVLITVACFAFTGAPPNIFYLLASFLVAVCVGISNWRSESRLAAQEDSLLLDAHWERHRAYLQRRRVWARLRYCAKCALTIDPITSQTASLFNVHELANSKVKQGTLR